MRHWWKETIGTGYDDKLLGQLTRLLFKKRKSVETADASQPDSAFAPQEETWRAIRDVLELRRRYLKRKGIKDPLYVLNSRQRAEFTQGARKEYEESEEQQVLQNRDMAKGWGKGLRFMRGRGFRCRGASQPATGKGRAKGKGHEQAGTGSLPNFLRQQKRKRWCRHLQRVCGTKQIWEILAFTGRFEVDTFREALTLRSADQDADTQEAKHDEEHSNQRRLLQKAKAEAQARYKAGRRLAVRRDAHGDPACGASQSARESGSSEMRHGLSPRQMVLLEDYDSGRLMRELNNAKVAWGHGRLRDEVGGYMDIGGSTGGVSRRIIDRWTPPDPEDFLEQAETMGEFVCRVSPKKR